MIGRRLLVPALGLVVCLASAVPASGQATTPSDPFWGEQAAYFDAIGVRHAWQRSHGAGVTMALIGNDGVDRQHEDLQGRIGDGFDPATGGPPELVGGHDTAAAGIAVANAGNGIGVAGVAPEAYLLPTIPSPEGRFEEEILWAVDNGARVLFIERGGVDPSHSLALGRVTGPAYQALLGAPSSADDPLGDALDYAVASGAVILGGAGNFSWPTCVHPSNYPQVLCVGGVRSSPPYLDDEPDTRSEYSNFGMAVDVMAPYDSWTTVWNNSEPERHDIYGGFYGTSAAVAYAAGAAALLMSAGATNHEIMMLLQCTATDLGEPGVDFFYGHGLIHVGRAMEAIGTGLTCEDNQPQNIWDLAPSPEE